MIDLDEMQARIRDANPIPHIDNLDADELATFVGAAHTRRAAILQAPTQQPDTVPPTRPLRRRRAPSLVVALAAAALVLTVIGSAAVIGILAGSDEVATVTQPPPVTTAVTPETTTRPPPTATTEQSALTVPTPSTVPLPPMEPLAWEPAPMSDELAGGMMSSVTIWDAGYLAGGGVLNASGRSDPAVWVSDDGSTWERVVSDAFDTGPRPRASDDLYVADVAVGPLGVIAVGGEGRAGSDEYDAAVWVSADTDVWQRVQLDPAVLGGEGSQAMRRVVAGGPGWVAIADVGQPKDATGIFVSADGHTWDRVPHAELATGGEALLIADLAVRDGLIVAVGHTPSADPNTLVDGPDEATLPYWLTTDFRQYRPLVWVSDDGYSWQLISLASPDNIPGDAGAVLEAITTTAAGDFVVVGKAADTRPAVWRSSDGRQWTPVPSVFQGLNPEWWVHEPMLPTVTELAGNLIVVGDCQRGGCAFGSTDQGATWSLIAQYDWESAGETDLTLHFYTGVLPDPQWNQNFVDIASHGETVLVVGSKAMRWNEDDQLVAAAWLGTTP